MKNRTPTRLLVLGFLGLGLVLVYLLRLNYVSTLARAADHADNLAQTLDGQISGTLRRLDATLNQVAQRLPAVALYPSAVTRHQPSVEALLRPYKTRFPELRDIFVYGADGNILYDTRPPPRVSGQGNIALRPAFIQLRDDREAAIAYSDLVRGAVSGQLTVAAYVPVRDGQGRLLAVVAGALHLEQFDQMFSALRLSPGSVAFVRSSTTHKLLIRYPWIEGEINKPVRNLIQARIDAGEKSGRAEFEAVTDGVHRLYGFRKIENYPFYVVVGISAHGALESWYRGLPFIGAVILGLAFLLGLTLRRMTQVEALREAARAEAGQALQLLREAINSLSGGIVIYDPLGRFVMCNEAHLQFFDRLRDVLVPGKTFETITREGVLRGLFPQATGQGEIWLTRRLREHLAADGQPHEIELATGHWLQYSDHRTPQGYTVGSRIDITERKKLEAELREQASTDALTGLPNRRHFLHRLEDELERVRRRTTREACVLMLDLDHFKRVNDQYGHVVGDSLLRHFANLLRQELRSVDTAGRMGGEEFAIILPGSGPEAARVFAQRICDRLAAQSLNVGRMPVVATVSIGIAAIADDDLSADAVLSRADGALYRAKEQGRNRVVLA